MQDDGTGNPIDLNQKLREDFYAALTEFGTCLRTALASRAFFEDLSFGESLISTYKKDLKFFSDLRRIAKQDAQETVDFSAYEDQIRKLVDRYVLGEKIIDTGQIIDVINLGSKQEPEEWGEEKTRNETDIIKSRLTRTIEQQLGDDPYAQKYFSDLLRKAIEEASAYFGYPLKQYAIFKDLEQRVSKRDVNDAPQELAGRRHASAYFGILRMVAGDAHALVEERQNFIDAAINIETDVQIAISENSLNPQNIEAAIRKTLLPKLFSLVGLDAAKEAIEQIVAVTRIGLSRDRKP